MQHTYTVTGILTDSRTVALDEPLPLTEMKVKVVVEPLGASAPHPYRKVLADIHSRQLSRGHRSPDRTAVDAALKAERESWEE